MLATIAFTKLVFINCRIVISHFLFNAGARAVADPGGGEQQACAPLFFGNYSLNVHVKIRKFSAAPPYFSNFRAAPPPLFSNPGSGAV